MKKIILVFLFLLLSAFAYPNQLNKLEDFIGVYNVKVTIEEYVNNNHIILFIYLPDKVSNKNFKNVYTTILVALARSIEMIKFDIDKYERIFIVNGTSTELDVTGNWVAFSSEDVKSSLETNNLKRIK
jgi:hypothetical protein